MAHKWEKLNGGFRHCLNCNKVQRWAKVCDGPRAARIKSGRIKYRFSPLAGRCSITKDGQPPQRRAAILAAIRDGRHTPRGIAAHASIPIATVRTALSLAKRQGHVVNPSRGRWELALVELEKENDEQD